MKTKIVLAGAVLAACVLPIRADEKENGKQPAPPSVKVNPQTANGPIDYSDFDSGFVQSLPKDKSDFTVKPPPGFVIGKIAPQKLPDDKIILPPQFLLHRTPPTSSPVQDDVRWRGGKWSMTSTSLSGVLQMIAQIYEVKIVTCFTPEKLAEDPKITMRLRGKTVAEKLDNLKVLGLVWRKIGETHFVAWSENDLPPLQKWRTRSVSEGTSCVRKIPHSCFGFVIQKSLKSVPGL